MLLASRVLNTASPTFQEVPEGSSPTERKVLANLLPTRVRGHLVDHLQLQAKLGMAAGLSLPLLCSRLSGKLGKETSLLLLCKQVAAQPLVWQLVERLHSLGQSVFRQLRKQANLRYPSLLSLQYLLPWVVKDNRTRFRTVALRLHRGRRQLHWSRLQLLLQWHPPALSR